MIVVTIVVRRRSPLEDRAQARALERARLLLLLPRGRLGQERPDQDQRQRGDDAGDERVAPGLVPATDLRQRVRVVDRQVVGARDQQPSDRREGLRPAQHRLAPLGVREQLGDPRHRGHELHRDAHEGGAAEEEQHLRRGGEAGGERRERVEQDAPHQHAAPPEEVGQVAAEQAEGPSRERRHPEQPADPGVELGAARRRAEQLQQRRPRDQRQHQQLVDVEGEAEGGDEADQPLGEGQRAELGPGRGHGAVLCASSEPDARTLESRDGAPAAARGDARGPAAGPRAAGRRGVARRAAPRAAGRRPARGRARGGARGGARARPARAGAGAVPPALLRGPAAGRSRLLREDGDRGGAAEARARGCAALPARRPPRAAGARVRRPRRLGGRPARLGRARARRDRRPRRSRASRRAAGRPRAARPDLPRRAPSPPSAATPASRCCA